MGFIFSIIFYLLWFYMCGALLVNSLIYFYSVVKFIYSGVSSKNWLNTQGLISTSEKSVTSCGMGNIYEGIIVFDCIVKDQ